MFPVKARSVRRSIDLRQLTCECLALFASRPSAQKGIAWVHRECDGIWAGHRVGRELFGAVRHDRTFDPIQSD